MHVVTYAHTPSYTLTAPELSIISHFACLWAMKAHATMSMDSQTIGVHFMCYSTTLSITIEVNQGSLQARWHKQRNTIPDCLAFSIQCRIWSWDKVHNSRNNQSSHNSEHEPIQSLGCKLPSTKALYKYMWHACIAVIPYSDQRTCICTYGRKIQEMNLLPAKKAPFSAGCQEFLSRAELKKCSIH